MVAVIGEAAVALRPEASKFGSQAEGEVNSSMPGIAKKAAGFFAAAFAAVKIGGFLVDAVGQASDLGESASKVGVVFGDAAGRVKDFSSTAASSLGISEAAALGATGTFGNLLRSTGLAEGAAADMSTSMVGLAADLASFNNASPEETLEALRAGLLGEAEPLKKFGVNLTAAAIEQKALQLGLIEGKEAMTDAQKATAAHALIMEQTSLAQGDFARTSDGLANQQRILAAEFDDVKAKVGNALLPVLQSLAGFVLDSVLPAVSNLAGEFEENFLPTLVTVGNWLRDTVLPVLQDLSAEFTENVLPVIKEVGAYITDTLIPALTDFSGWLYDNRDAIAVVGAIIGAILLPHLVRLAAQAAITRAATAAMWLASKVGAVTTAATNVAATYSMIAAWVAARVAALVSFGQTIAIMALYAASSIASAASATAAWVGSAARTVASLVVTAAGFVVQGAIMVATMAVTVASVVAGWVLMGAQSLLAAARMAAAWLIAMGPIGWIIIAVVGLVALIIANWETVKSVTVGAFNAVVGAVTGAFHAVVGAVSSGISNVIGFFTGLPGRILSAIGNLGSLLLNAGRSLMEGFVNGISAAGEFVGDIAGSIWRAVRGFINSNVIDKLNGLLEFSVMGVTVNPPDIPRLHSGGVFDTGAEEGYALLRRQERVATPEQRVVADNLLAQLLDGTLTTPGNTANPAAPPVQINQQITQMPGESGAVLAARISDRAVWNLNAGITRPSRGVPATA